MVTKTATILNESGLHARPATEFVETAKRFQSKIKICRPGEDAVNAKSVVMLLSCGFSQGESVEISAEGEDEDGAVQALEDVVKSGFGEL